MRNIQKIRKTPSGDWIYVSFTAHPEELEEFKKIAQSGDLSLSKWLRRVANNAVKAEKKEREGSHDGIPETEVVDLEKVPTHRP